MTKDTGDVFTKIEELLNANGSVTQPVRDRLLMMAVTVIHTEVNDLRDSINAVICKQSVDEKGANTYQDKSDRRMDKLERNSIVNWIDKNPKTALFLVVLFFALLYSDAIKTILALLGFDI